MMRSRTCCGPIQDPGLAPNVIFGTTFFNPLAALLKNSTALLQALKSENVSTIVDINARERPQNPSPLTYSCFSPKPG